MQKEKELVDLVLQIHKYKTHITDIKITNIAQVT